MNNNIKAAYRRGYLKGLREASDDDRLDRLDAAIDEIEDAIDEFSYLDMEVRNRYKPVFNNDGRQHYVRLFFDDHDKQSNPDYIYFKKTAEKIADKYGLQCDIENEMNQRHEILSVTARLS